MFDDLLAIDIYRGLYQNESSMFDDLLAIDI